VELAWKQRTCEIGFKSGRKALALNFTSHRKKKSKCIHWVKVTVADELSESMSENEKLY
jgi:hypothetical protein